MKYAEILVREINPEDTYGIRNQILRPGRPLEEVKFEGDLDTSTIHIGGFFDGKMLGIATFVKNSHKNFLAKNQYQLRGMAVLPDVQKMNLGGKVLQWGEAFLKEQRNTELIWCNAREMAVKFYKKHGYDTHGEYFDIPGVCTHIVMYKYL